MDEIIKALRELERDFPEISNELRCESGRVHCRVSKWRGRNKINVVYTSLSVTDPRYPSSVIAVIKEARRRLETT